MSKSLFVCFVVFAAGLLLIGCSSGDSKKFVGDAAQGGMLEVELGRLAAQKAGSEDVRNFGIQMVSDHTRANAELKSVAARKNMQVSSELSSSQKSTVDKLAKLSGAEFDKAYMSDMVSDHETDVKEFQTQADKGNDPDVKAFAAKTLPVLQKHLQMARDVASQVGAK